VDAGISLMIMGMSKQGTDVLATLGVTASYRVIATKRYIAEQKEEQAIKDIKLVDLVSLDFHSMNDYLKAINTYTQL
ncbi:5265_t:CDS:2, partial [Dentiscutata heterogama]